MPGFSRPFPGVRPQAPGKRTRQARTEMVLSVVEQDRLKGKGNRDEDTPRASDGERLS